MINAFSHLMQSDKNNQKAIGRRYNLSDYEKESQ